MSDELHLFRNEEDILTGAKILVKQYQQEAIIPLSLYQQIIVDYERLLKQTKRLVRMSDRQQQQLNEKMEIIEHVNQEKNEFLSIVAHDLKNPLSGILGLAEIIEDMISSISKEELLEYSKMIQESAETMFQLITNLLDVNAIESGNANICLKNVDLLPIVQIVIKNYQERARLKGITLELWVNENEYIALVDQNTIQRILDNLISNAIKYSPHHKYVYVYIFCNNNAIRCEIQDEGMGISEADQKKLFGKFTRLTAKPTGGEHSTGLGLFIVKKLIEAMQGKVWCESELGKGAKFIIELPNAG